MSESQDRIRGRCKWFQKVRGCGFLTSAAGEDVFVHASAVGSGVTLLAGDQVELAVAPDGRGREKAVAVVRLAARPPTRCIFERPEGSA